jgi:CMP-N-acetylneuraminic acid synthetase
VNVSVAAIVPMRHTSERVPGKNYRPLAGIPLFHHIVRALLDCPSVSKVVIDTDSEVILDDAARSFPTVVGLERPAHLRDGSIPMNDVLLNDIDRVEADLYLQTHSTNPLLRSQTIEQAIGTFLARRDEHDSLFGVTRLQTRLWRGDGSAINHDPAVLLRTQDLPPVYEENSCIYIFDAGMLRATGRRIGERPLLFEISRAEALDIDEEIDWQIVECLLAGNGTPA